jgi:hypothetical protein
MQSGTLCFAELRENMYLYTYTLIKAQNIKKKQTFTFSPLFAIKIQI